MAGLTSEERYYAAHCVLLFVTSIAAVIVTFGLTWMARQQRDPARRCLTFIKLAAVCYIIFCFVEFCADAVWIAFSRLMRSEQNDDDDDWGYISILLQTRVELSAASRFTDCLVIVFVFLSIVSLTTGVNVIRIGEPAPHDKLIKRVSYVIAGLLGALALVVWGISIKVFTEFYTEEYDLRAEDVSILKLLNISRKLDLAFVVVVWILSVAAIVRSTQIWLPSRRDKRLDHPLLFLMLCCAVWFIRSTYEIVYQIKFVNVQDLRSNPDTPPYLEIIEIVFHSWTIFLVIILMLLLGVKKKGGLWSTEQPWSSRNVDEDGDGAIPLDDIRSLPPAYSPTPAEPSVPAPVATNDPPSAGPHSGASAQESWRHSRHATTDDLEEGDRGLVEGLGPPRRYQAPVAMDNAYNTGIVVPESPTEAGPSDGYPMDMRMPSHSPPPHDEVMGLNHQADGRPPQDALPYPEKN